MTKLHEESHWKGMFHKYEIHNDRLKLDSIMPLQTLEIHFDTIERIELGQAPVILDMLKKGYMTPEYGFGLRVLKNDLADLFEHVVIEAKVGYWKQYRITPNDAQLFHDLLELAMDNYRKT